MVIDLRTCGGCKLCTLSCQKRHNLRDEQTWIRVYTMKDSTGGTFPMPRPCMMCEDPPCMYVCPVGATLRTDEGLVLARPDLTPDVRPQLSKPA
jgi:dimethyl sulfoxide reductase iron-sulfur subunit